MLVVLIWCYSGGAERISNYITNRAEHPSDVIYIERLRERRARMEEEKKQTPEERRKTLEASFERNNVRMVSSTVLYVGLKRSACVVMFHRAWISTCARAYGVVASQKY